MLRRIFSIQRIPVLLSFISAILLTVPAETIIESWSNPDPANDPNYRISLVVAGVGILFAIAAVVADLRIRRVRTRFQPPATIRNPVERNEHARRGLIAFVSLYRPPRDAGLSPDAIQQAIEAEDYKRLYLEESNLKPLIEMIKIHMSKLEYCWLIATSSETDAGSIDILPTLEKYLYQHVIHKENGDPATKIYWGEQYAVSLDDDALVAVRAHKMVEKIYSEANALGLEDQEVVADFSAGQRSLVFGMIAACIDEARIVQFFGTAYDAAGNPTGKGFPVIFDFSPEIERG